MYSKDLQRVQSEDSNSADLAIVWLMNYDQTPHSGVKIPLCIAIVHFFGWKLTELTKIVNSIGERSSK